MSNNKKYRFVFAGGGTGGHLFPAVAVAQQLRILLPDSDIMFIGTKDKIEGRVVPTLGYQFVPIWIRGLQRRITFQNLTLPIKLVSSLAKCFLILKKYRPQVAIGSGGYVAGPALWAANKVGSKIVLLESNSLPGKTTLMLEKYADEVHVAFEDSKKYFKNKENIYLSGNPVRTTLNKINKVEAKKKFGLNDKRTILILGGSLGAKSINNAIENILEDLKKKDFQIIWQTGKNYFNDIKHLANNDVKVFEFIEDMQAAFSAADLLISRAGATTIAEITALGIASILVPSPNVAENHQYHNAKSLVDQKGCILIEDKNLNNSLFNEINSLFLESNLLSELEQNSKRLGKADAAEVIAKKIIQLANESLQ